MQGWPLAGRAEELTGALQLLRRDPPEAVLLAGEAGVGKTRLAREIQGVLSAEGVVAVVAPASSAARSIPLGAMAGLLPPEVSGGAGLTLLQAARRRLGDLAGRSQALLVVDDAHLLDDVSATLLHQVVAERVCPVLATLRTGTEVPDAVTALWTAGWTHRLELRTLSRPETAQLLTGALGGPVDPRTVRLLHEASGGNALYLTELVRGARDAGTLVDEGGLWRLRARLQVPPALAELVGSRLAGLDGEARTALELVAVAGSVGLADLEIEVSAAALERLEHSGLVDVAVDGRRHEVSLGHPVYGEVVRSRLSVLRARRIRTALADRVAARGARRRGDALRVAVWQLDAGAAGDPDLLLRAAGEAAVRRDWALTERIARAAWDAGGGVPAGCRVAEAAFKLGRQEDALAWFERLLPLAADDADRARVVDGLAYVLSNQLGRYSEAVQRVGEALATVQDPATRSRLQFRLGTEHVFAGHPDLGLATLEPLLADDGPASHRAAYIAALARWAIGRYDDAAALSESGLHRHATGAVESQQPAETHLIARALADADAGRLEQAFGYAERLRDAAAALDESELQASAALVLGYVAERRGDLRAAAEAFRAGAVLNRDTADTTALRWCLAGLLLVAGQRGRDDAEARGELLGLEPGEVLLLELDLVERGLAWAQVAAGDAAAARARLAAAAERADRHGLVCARTTLLHDLVRIGGPDAARRQADRLARVAESCQGALPRALATHARAVADRDAIALQAVAARLAELGALLLAREAATEAVHAHRSAHRSRQAAAAARVADSLAGATATAATPSLLRPAPRPELTRREQEVAVMAATGMPSKEIARRLVLSPRTVDNHLERAYTKLGISGRGELPRVLGPGAAGTTEQPASRS